MCIRRTRPSLTSFFLGVAKKGEVPICSASTSLTYPSSIRQAGTRTSTADPCKLQRNKHELPVNTPSPNTHKLLVLQISPLHGERRKHIFLIVPPQYYLPLLQVCRFLHFFKLTGQGPDNFFASFKEPLSLNYICLITCVEVLFIAFSRISTKSFEPISNFKPRGKCIWLIARVVAQTLFLY